MDATAKAITALLLENWPNPYCYSCLAIKLQVSEREVRESAQALVLVSAVRIRRLRCANCGRVDDLLQKLAG
jgi:hypothetical protein